ncbi:hypothetical protein OsI_18885 [Oryza sativa Indica Group]|uniref:Uncharacterized protein n=1 Tax=Oryza sativa subsp. indica TaxID=39946 RepID=A2Y1K5_ORYSI|nr:hypothetical protein OsI_18885 [Oryza sativa Indica Group]
MKEGSQDVESKAKVHPLVQGDDEIKGEQPNTDAPLGDSDSLSAASNDNKRVSREDIELVQNLIERCLQLYMNRGEVVRTLSTRARIEPGFTTLVWQKLEEENSEFFRAYYIRLKLKKQINLFNHLLEHQYHLMKYPVPQQVPLTPTQNGIRPMPVLPTHVSLFIILTICLWDIQYSNNLEYLLLFSLMLIRCLVVHLVAMCMTENEVPGSAHAGAMSSEMAVSPSSAMSSNHVSFTPDISGMDVDASTVNATFGDDLGNGGPLQIGPNGGDSSSLGQQIWDFSLSDLSADLTNLGDLAALENYSGNPFLPSDSDIFESPDDDIVEYFADAINGPSQSDEEK